MNVRPEHGSIRTVLDPQELSTRIKAARLLRGISQKELAERVAEAGLPWRLVGSLERGDIPMRSGHRQVLADALGFPERWFEVPVDDLCVEAPDASVIERLDRIEELLSP